MLDIDEFFDAPIPTDGVLLDRLYEIGRQRVSKRVLKGHLDAVFNTHRISMFGTPERPVSDRVRAAVIFKSGHRGRPQAMFVDANGLLRTWEFTAWDGEGARNADILAALHDMSSDGSPTVDGKPGAPFIPNLNPFSSVFKQGMAQLSYHITTSFSAQTFPESEDVPPHANLPLIAMLKRRLGACRKTIFAALDPDVRAVMHQCLDGDAGLLSRLTGAHGFGHHPDWRRRRDEVMKLVDQYPGFVTLLKDPNSAVSREIDGFRNMKAGLCADTGLSPEQVSALRKRTHRSLFFVGKRPGNLQVDTPIWTAYAAYPADALRTTRPKLLWTLADVRLVGLDRRIITDHTRKVLLDAVRDAKSSPLLRDLLHTPSWKKEQGQHFREKLKDATRFLNTNVVSPLDYAAGEDPVVREILRDLILPSTLTGLARTSAHYHEDFNLADFRAATTTKLVSWAGLTTRIAAPEGTVRELTSAAALIRQGSNERHCVGGYDAVVLHRSQDAQTVILSVEKDGTVLGTAEVRFSQSAGGDRLIAYVAQHQAAGNTEPSAEARKILKGFLLACERGLTGADLQAYRDALPQRTAAGTFQSREDALLRMEAVWGKVRPMVSKAAAKMGPRACLDKAVRLARTTQTHDISVPEQEMPRLTIRLDDRDAPAVADDTLDDFHAWMAA